MNNDQIKGAAKQVAGKVQQKAGELLDSPKTIVKGLANQAEGKVQKAAGDMKEAAEKARNR